MSRAELVDSNFEIWGFSLKEDMKLGFAAITIVCNGIAITAGFASSPTALVAAALAVFALAFQIAERLYPPLKGERKIFAEDPYSLYHIAQLAHFLLSFTLLVGGEGPLLLFVWNSVTARPSLHYLNETAGQFLI